LAPEALLQSLGIVEPADLDIEAIAYHVGLKVKHKRLKCCEAMITGMGDRGIVFVQEGTMAARGRFSIAHELGHWARDRGQTVACRSTDIGRFSKTNSVERAADQYAADLLMPWGMFKAACRENPKLDLKTLKTVAGLFQCSYTATLIRMIDSGVYPNVMMVVHKAGEGRKWFRAATKVPTYWFPRDDLDSESPAFEMLHDPLTRDEGFPRKIGADAWFSRPGSDRFEITEQSFRVPDEGVVTILRLHEMMIGF
jgi:hypothetical protein